MPSWRPASFSTDAADVVDHAGFLGKADEAFGREQAHRRMAPAHQRLEAGEVHVGEPRDRLVVDLDLVALDGAAELRSSTTSSARSSHHRGVEELDAAVPLRLRLVERDGGILQQLLGRQSVAAVLRDADARR